MFHGVLFIILLTGRCKGTKPIMLFPVKVALFLSTHNKGTETIELFLNGKLF